MHIYRLLFQNMMSFIKMKRFLQLSTSCRNNPHSTETFQAIRKIFQTVLKPSGLSDVVFMSLQSTTLHLLGLLSLKA